MKNQTFLQLITNKWTQLYSTYLFWIVSKSLKFTHLTFHLKRPWINTEIHKNKKFNHFMHDYTWMNTTHTSITILNTFIKSDILTLPLTLPKNYIKIFKNQMLPLKPPYNTLQFINILPLQNICGFRDIDPFLYPYPIFSGLPNLNFLTKGTQKYKFHKFLPWALSSTQNKLKEPNRPWINPYFDYEIGVDILWKTLPIGDLISLTLISLAFSKSSQIEPSSSNHLKSMWSMVMGAVHNGDAPLGGYDSIFSIAEWRQHSHIHIHTDWWWLH